MRVQCYAGSTTSSPKYQRTQRFPMLRFFGRIGFGEARRLAAEALGMLGEDVRPPELSHVTWVKGSH
jgi:hypothetical protein